VGKGREDSEKSKVRKLRRAENRERKKGEDSESTIAGGRANNFFMVKETYRGDVVLGALSVRKE